MDFVIIAWDVASYAVLYATVSRPVETVFFPSRAFSARLVSGNRHHGFWVGGSAEELEDSGVNAK